MQYRAGYVYYGYYKPANKNKYIFCISPNIDGDSSIGIFFFINSVRKYPDPKAPRPRPDQEQDACYLEPYQLDFLRHISFINTGKAEEVELSQFKPKPIPKLKMKSMSLKITNNTIKLKIKRKANQSKRLGDDYKKLVAKI